MAVRPGGRRYNSEVKILTSLEGINSSKRGLRDLGQLMRGLVLSGGKFRSMSEQMTDQIARMGVESNVYQTHLKNLGAQYDMVLDSVRTYNTIDPMEANREHLQAYLDLIQEVYKTQEEINALTDEQRIALGITEEQAREYSGALGQMLQEYRNLSGVLQDVVDVQTDLTFIEEDLADGSRQLGILYNGVVNEIGLMGQELAKTSETSQQFLNMLMRSASVLKDFFRPAIDNVKEMTAEFAKDRIAKFIYGRLGPAGSEANKIMGQLAPNLKNVAGAAGPVGASLGTIAVAATAVIGAVLALVAALAAFTQGLMMNIKTMEQYREASFRAAGSLRDLTNATYDLSAEIGVSNEEAIKSVKALSTAGFAFDSLGESVFTTTGEVIKGDEALARLAKTNAIFVKATGASADTVAGLQKSLTAMGVAIDRQEALLGALTQASEKYGITGSQLNEIVGTLKDQSILLTKVLDKTNFNEYAAGFVVMAGAARQLGIEMSVVTKLMRDIAEGKDAALALAAFGGQLAKYFDNDAANNLMATAEGAERILEISKNMSGIVRTQFLASFGGEKELELLRQTAEERRNMSQEEIDAQKQLNEQRAALTRSYNESLQTITQQLQRLFAPVLSAIAKVVGPLVDMLIDLFTGAELTEFTNVLMGTMEIMKEAFEPFIEASKAGFELLSEIFGLIWDIAEPLMPVLKVIGSIMYGAIFKPMKMIFEILTTVIKAVRWLGDLFKRISGITELTDSVIRAGEAIGKLFESISDWVSNTWDKTAGRVIKWFDEIDQKLEESVVWSFLKELASGLYDLAGPIGMITSGFELIADAATAIEEAIFGSSAFHLKESIMGDIMPALQLFRGLLEALLWPLQMIGEMISSIVGFVMELPGALSEAFNVINELGAEAWGSMSGLASQAWDSMDSIGGSIMDSFSESADWISGQVSGFADSASSYVGDVTDSMSNAFDGATRSIGDAVSWLASPFTDDEPQAAQEVSVNASVDQVPTAYTVKVEERANTQGRLMAQMAESTEMSRQILSRLLEQINDDTPAGRETAERLRQLIDLQGEHREDYPAVASGFGERTNMWYAK